MGETMIHPGTGERLARDVRPFVVEYKGLSRTVALLGWYPEDGGDGVVVVEDMAAADQALAELKARARDCCGLRLTSRQLTEWVD